MWGCNVASSITHTPPLSPSDLDDPRGDDEGDVAEGDDDEERDDDDGEDA